ncbi:MAG TPA: MerR family transcriptional regulator [Chloroflexia bacterium]|nr:MerR family transcriptional regulator [Chloroflexia bacterium]
MGNDGFTRDDSDFMGTDGGGTQARGPQGASAGRDADQATGATRERTGTSRGRGGGRVSRLSQITADRPIFTLSVAADLLGLHPRTLRIYEEKKLVVPARTEGNRRRYSQNDIQRFQFIRRLTGSGVNLEGVRIILGMADELSRLGGDPNAIIERSLQMLDSESDGDDR